MEATFTSYWMRLMYLNVIVVEIEALDPSYVSVCMIYDSCYFKLINYLFVYFGFSQDRISLCNPGCPGTCSVDQAGLELKRLTCLYLLLG